jgi:hypothetical protein
MRINGGRRRGTVRARVRVRVRSSVVALSLAGVAAMGLTAGCGMDLRDHECMSDEYPVKATGPEGGSACQTNGQAPPAGYVRFPAGQVPQRVGDKWDVYWETHGLDDKGRLIKN